MSTSASLTVPIVKHKLMRVYDNIVSTDTFLRAKSLQCIEVAYKSQLALQHIYIVTMESSAEIYTKKKKTLHY